MEALITRSDILAVKPLNKLGGDTDELYINSLIISTQKNDLSRFLGLGFMNNIILNRDDQAYQDLINGSEFTDVEGVEHSHEGLKRLLIDLVWYRYNIDNHFKSSRAGLISTNVKGAKKPTLREVKSHYRSYKKEAEVTWLYIQYFLEETRPNGWTQTFQNENGEFLTDANAIYQTYCPAGSRGSSGLINADTLQGKDLAFVLNRANHVGGIDVGDIAGFNEAVSNNSAVKLNTAKNSYPEEDKNKLDELPYSSGLDDLLNEKVDKVIGKDLSTNDYTDADKTKLSDLRTNDAVDDLLDEKVDKVVGKELSTNDFTDAYESKLDGLRTNDDVDDLLDEKVDKVIGKELSTNDFTNAYESKLDGLRTNDAVDDLLNDKVDKVVGKELSTNDFTDAYKTKLSGLRTNDAVDDLLNEKVDKVTGKELSTNDFTNVYKNKLDGLRTNDAVDDLLNEKVDKVIGKDLSTNDYADADKTKLSDLRTNDAVDDLLDEKVDKVIGKELSTNDFTDAYESKLDGLRTNDAVDDLLNDKVDKVVGKELSTNDFTDAYKTRLDNAALTSDLTKVIPFVINLDSSVTSRDIPNTDVGRLNVINNASNIVMNVNVGTGVNFGDRFDYVKFDKNITFNEGLNVSIFSKKGRLNIGDQYTVVSLIYLGSNNYLLIGDLI